MPYAFEPRDLDDPRPERAAVASSDPLAEAFAAWVDDCRGVDRPEIGGSTSEVRYQLARDHLEGIDVDATDIGTVLLSFDGAVPADAGLFLSAAYNRSDRAVHCFDVETARPIERLGYRLVEEKALVIDADIASTMAVEARGLVVNRARVGSYFGYSAHGAFVNGPSGSCQTAGLGAARVFVNFGEIRSRPGGPDSPRLSVGGAHGRGSARGVMTADDCAAVTGLGEYLDGLRSGLSGDRESVSAFIGDLSPHPRAAIAAELGRLLDREATAE